MILREMVERFERQAPICVMIRAALENVLEADRLDALFGEVAVRQENKKLLFWVLGLQQNLWVKIGVWRCHGWIF